MVVRTNPTACIIVIGNEVLSGRTQDVNIQFLARGLAERGIVLGEVRIIPDEREVIIATVNEMRGRFDHVFTTGGIGPTHDDITSESIAAAFGVPWEKHPEAWALLEARYPPGAFNPARQRMATLPRGAGLIDNPVSGAPGFTIGNVHVMAGVPRIMQAMFRWLAPRLAGGPPVVQQAVYARDLPEGRLAEGLGELQHTHAGVDLGSYPYERLGGKGVAVVAKGTDPAAVEAACAAVAALMQRLGADPQPGEPPR